ncbi:MAG: hypothetical protein C3F06_02375 [Candidatus Methanoperedenaceae archaeon]|nr:MAG: hypothetical protein C3F06_02375 [Candidatus Methanoperedenaceae archaeon]
MNKKTNSPEDLILQKSKDRIKLLRSGFKGAEIEALYIDLNHFETLQINWDDSVTNRKRKAFFPNYPFMNLTLSKTPNTILSDSMCVKAASSMR